jgi:hypothetical protein
MGASRPVVMEDLPGRFPLPLCFTPLELQEDNNKINVELQFRRHPRILRALSASSKGEGGAVRG